MYINNTFLTLRNSPSLLLFILFERESVYIQGVPNRVKLNREIHFTCILCLLNNTCFQHNFKSVHVSNFFWSREYNSAKEICKYASFSKVGGNYPLDLKMIWSSVIVHNLFLSWHSWKIAHLALNNNHSVLFLVCLTAWLNFRNINHHAGWNSAYHSLTINWHWMQSSTYVLGKLKGERR